MTIRLVHLSDIHFGGYGKGWDEDEDQRSELLRDLERLVVVGGTVDGVLVGGDIAFGASSAEYETARMWLEEVCAVGGCDISRVWMVPGNHDLGRDILKLSLARSDFRTAVLGADLNDVDRILNDRLAKDPAGSSLMAPFEEYNRFAARWNCSFIASQPHWFDETLGLGSVDVRITGLNSVLISDTRDKANGGAPQLALGTWQCKLPRSHAQIHIAVCHHPPNWILDWALVKPYLHRAHLLLFGHEHRYQARQLVDGGTVEVFAGAVGPETIGAPSDSEYGPSWNLLELELVEDEVSITVNPRTWYHEERTRFDLHPDEVRIFRVKLDLEQVYATGGTMPAELEGEPHDGALPASPLIPEQSEGADAEPVSAGERSSRRGLGVRFMRLPPTVRVEVAHRLGVAEGLDDIGLSDNEMGREILQRIRIAGAIDRLAEELGSV